MSDPMAIWHQSHRHFDGCCVLPSEEALMPKSDPAKPLLQECNLILKSGLDTGDAKALKLAVEALSSIECDCLNTYAHMPGKCAETIARQALAAMAEAKGLTEKGDGR